MNQNNRIFARMLQSSVWKQPLHIRVVWVSMLAMMDERGVCDPGGIQGLSMVCNVSIKEAAEAVAYLSSNDPHSRDSSANGARIEVRDDGSFVVINKTKHEKMAQKVSSTSNAAKRMREYRMRKLGIAPLMGGDDGESKATKPKVVVSKPEEPTPTSTVTVAQPQPAPPPPVAAPAPQPAEPPKPPALIRPVAHNNTIVHHTEFGISVEVDGPPPNLSGPTREHWFSVCKMNGLPEWRAEEEWLRQEARATPWLGLNVHGHAKRVLAWWMNDGSPDTREKYNADRLQKMSKDANGSAAVSVIEKILKQKRLELESESDRVVRKQLIAEIKKLEERLNAARESALKSMETK